MKWIKGDIMSAFADLPDMRVRANEYMLLSKHRDTWLNDLERYTVFDNADSNAFETVKRRVSNCASTIIWGANDKGTTERLIWGNFCENQWCPICNRKKSVRIGHFLNSLMEKLYEKGYRFYHLVLSDKNCNLDNLKDTLKLYSDSWQRFYNSTLRAKYSGYYISLEYTLRYNRGAVELHPHFHVLLAASPEQLSQCFIPQNVLIKKWRRSLKIDQRFLPSERYDPRVWIKSVKKGDTDIFLELTKYLFDFGNFSNFIRKHPFLVSFSQLYFALLKKKFHRGSGVLALSDKNTNFVQLRDSFIPYEPRYAIFSRLNHNTYRYNLKYVVDINDSIPLAFTDNIGPIQAFLKTYIKHQVFNFGNNAIQSGPIHLPDWWEDLSCDPIIPRIAPGDSPPLSDYYHFVEFDKFEIESFENLSWKDLFK